jgi:hypothetical protein
LKPSRALSGAARGSGPTPASTVGSSPTQNIYRPQYTLAAPITLQAGEYWFSHDASIAAWMGIALVSGLRGVRTIRQRLARRAA